MLSFRVHFHLEKDDIIRRKIQSVSSNCLVLRIMLVVNR